MLKMDFFEKNIVHLIVYKKYFIALQLEISPND